MANYSEVEINFMKRALELAKKGLGKTSPNPMVGAVIVKDNKIISEGYHQKSGQPHAEPNAINSAKSSIEGSTLYCTLEPCCHRDKKTPPCTDLIIKSGISEVVCASLDPNPKVAGKGLELLQENGIKTSHGLLKENENKLNKVFRVNMLKNRPYIHLKVAQTIDGKISDYKQQSKWITDENARKDGHFLRAIYDGILVSSGTVVKDNPKLDLRYGWEEKYKSPIPIIFGRDSEELRSKDLFKKQHLYYDSDQHKLKEFLELIWKDGVSSVLVEGGPKVISKFFEENIFDEITVYIAPKIIGTGKSSFSDMSLSISDAKNLVLESNDTIGDQIKLNFINI